MKSCTFRKIFILFIALALSSVAETAGPVRLAVMNITQSSELRHQSEIAANTFLGTLAKSKALALAEREELDLVIREQKINASELEGAAGKIGGIMGLQYMLLVSMVYDDSPVVSARLVDLSSSQIVYSDTEIPDSLDDSAMSASSSRMADRLLEVLAGEQAVITGVHSKEVIINRGSNAGVRAGDMYRVYMGTKRNPMNIAVIRVKDVRSGFSYAELVKKGGKIELIRRSDRIEAVSKKEAETLIKNGKLAQKRPGEKKGFDPAGRLILSENGNPMDISAFRSRKAREQSY